MERERPNSEKKKVMKRRVSSWGPQGLQGGEKKGGKSRKNLVGEKPQGFPQGELWGKLIGEKNQIYEETPKEIALTR